jgi:hypothetical protein
MKPEPMKPEPIKPEPVKPTKPMPEMTKPEPAMPQPEMTKPEPAMPEMTKPEPMKPEIAKPEMTKPVPENPAKPIFDVNSISEADKKAIFTKLTDIRVLLGERKFSEARKELKEVKTLATVPDLEETGHRHGTRHRLFRTVLEVRAAIDAHTQG